MIVAFAAAVNKDFVAPNEPITAYKNVIDLARDANLNLDGYVARPCRIRLYTLTVIMTSCGIPIAVLMSAKTDQYHCVTCMQSFNSVEAITHHEFAKHMPEKYCILCICFNLGCNGIKGQTLRDKRFRDSEFHANHQPVPCKEPIAFRQSLPAKLKPMINRQLPYHQERLQWYQQDNLNESYGAGILGELDYRMNQVAHK